MQNMEKTSLDLQSATDPFYTLLYLLSIDTLDRSREELERALLEYDQNIVFEVKNRKYGNQHWPQTTDFLEEISQKNRHIFIIWNA